MESRCVIALLVVLAMAFAPSAGASLRWVQPSYYGINFQQLRNLGPSERNKHLKRIASLGIHQIRLGIAWPRVEPLPPVGGNHDYRWAATDSEIATMARHGITAQANITQTPRWDAASGIISNLNCAKSSSWAPLDLNPYVQLTQAIASRYGRGGTFWKTHASLPRTPIVRYEIWNEPNLRGGWCPSPQPERYADMFVGATRAIRAVDPKAQVVTGGVAPPAKENVHYLSIAHFLGRVTARQPAVNKLARGVAVHIYPSLQPSKQLKRIAWFRDQVRQGGVPNKVPMLVNEIGWPTQGGSSTITEAERAKAYAAATANIPRTNCNIMGMLPQAWTSAEQSKKNPEDWYGIAGPETAKPYPSAHRYAHGIRLMTGQLSDDPPLKPLMACPGMPAPPIPGGSGGGPPGLCTITGTAGPDDLIGTGKRDVICGLGGRDVIHGGGGDDIIVGGDGVDRIFGGPGRDRIKGKRGGDRLEGAGGVDTVIGGRGPDQVTGGRGPDDLGGSSGRDKLSGGAGNDLLKGGPNNDVLRGGAGHDVLRGGPGRDRKFQ
jgi:hypothetical protein